MEITVIIPTYNRYTLLQRALASVFAQTYFPKEIIVIDDGSYDETFSIQNDFPNVKYIYQENSGVSSARNRGIEEAECEWVAFLDSDDEWCEEKLRHQVAFHRQTPDILMSYTDEVWIRDGKEVKIPKKFQKIGCNIFLENLSYCNIAPSSVLLHKKVLHKVGFFDEALEVCEDYDLWLRIALEFEIAFLDRKLVKKYAGHKDQLSFKYWGMDRFRVLALEKLSGVVSEIPDRAGNDRAKVPSSSGLPRGSGFHTKELIKKELIKKYTLLLKGAKKYGKIQDIQLYENKLEQLKG